MAEAFICKDQHYEIATSGEQRVKIQLENPYVSTDVATWPNYPSKTSESKSVYYQFIAPLYEITINTAEGPSQTKSLIEGQTLVTTKSFQVFYSYPIWQRYAGSNTQGTFYLSMSGSNSITVTFNFSTNQCIITSSTYMGSWSDNYFNSFTTNDRAQGVVGSSTFTFECTVLYA